MSKRLIGGIVSMLIILIVFLMVGEKTFTGNTVEDGRIIHVTNLADSGEGSLREAIGQLGEKIIVFDVSGEIQLKENILIDKPNLIIRGQTSKEGVCLRGVGIKIVTTNVVIEHLCSRPGDEIKKNPEENHGFDIVNSSNILLNHVSASWAVDENIGIWNSTNVTVQWSIISEGLKNSTHPKGPHSMGILIGDNSTDILIKNNLFAHNNRRNPRVKGGVSAVVINNVIYDYGDGGLEVGEIEHDKLPLFLDVIGNYYIPSNESDKVLILHKVTWGSKIYIGDNLGLEKDRIRNYTSDSPLFWNGKVQPAEEVYKDVLKNAGANPTRRDVVDSRIINEVKTRTGRIIDSQKDVL